MEDNESGFLEAFDAEMDRIHKVADEVYSHGGKGKGSYTYTLEADDF